MTLKSRSLDAICASSDSQGGLEPKYRYTQTCFFYKAMSGTMFDQNNAVVTDYGAGPGWAITHQKPSVCAHVHQTTPLKYKVMQPPGTL